MVGCSTRHSSNDVAAAIEHLFSHVPAGLFKSITHDQGKEFFNCKQITKRFGTASCFGMRVVPVNVASPNRQTGCFANFFPHPQWQEPAECGKRAAGGPHNPPLAQEVRLQDNCGKNEGRRGVLRVNFRLTICQDIQACFPQVHSLPHWL